MTRPEKCVTLDAIELVREIDEPMSSCDSSFNITVSKLFEATALYDGENHHGKLYVNSNRTVCFSPDEASFSTIFGLLVLNPIPVYEAVETYTGEKTRTLLEDLDAKCIALERELEESENT